MPKTPVKFCSGFGQHDTPRLSKNPQSFLRITYKDIEAMAEDPQDRPKEKAQWVIPSTLPSRVYETQRKQGDRHFLTFDKDKNPDITLEELFSRACGVTPSNFILYTSKGASEDNQKARIIVPLKDPVPGEMGVMLQTILNNRMEAAGIISDRAMEGGAQLCYLPNRGEFYRSLSVDFIGPFDALTAWGEDIAKIQEQEKAEEEARKIRKIETDQKARERIVSGKNDVMVAFKESYIIEYCLDRYGYKRIGKKYLSPNSESGNPGVSITPDGQKWFSHHSSDAGIGKQDGDGTFGDSWDLFKFWEHRNNQVNAFHAAGDMFYTETGETWTHYAQRTHMENKSEKETVEMFESLSNHSGGWDTPESLERQVPAAPDFPIDALPEDVRLYVEDHVERIQCPVDMMAMAAIVELAGLIGKDATIRPKDLDSEWSERACLWHILISPKSTMKSSALKAGLKNINRIQARDSVIDAQEKKKYLAKAYEYEMRKKAFDKICKDTLKNDPSAELPEIPESLKEPPTKPQSRRRIIKDSTLEKTADLMILSPGLTMATDELAGFMLNMNRYSVGSDRQFYLECYSGGTHHVDRVSRGEQFIPNMYMNIVGGIQPTVARQIFCSKDSDDGFFERFVPVYPERKKDWKLVDRYPNLDIRDMMSNLCDKLAGKNWFKILSRDNDSNNEAYGKPYVSFDSHAQKTFDAWLTQHMAELANMDEDDPVLGFAGKRRGLLVRLCLIFHLAKWAGGDHTNVKLVSDETLKDALTLLEGYIIPMQERVMAAFSMSEFDDDVQRIIRWIKTKKIKKFKSREILRKQWSGMKVNKDIIPKLEYLVELNWLRLEPTEPGEKGGRSTNVFLVNPAC